MKFLNTYILLYIFLSSLLGCGGGNGSVSNSIGIGDINSSTSENPVAPTISSQPLSISVYVAETARFTILTGGTAPLSYQWRKAGVNILGATDSSYITPSVTAADNGAEYSVVVTNSFGSVSSNNALLSVVTAAPGISSQPVETSVYEGETFTLSVKATGIPTLTYQWMKNGVAISGADSSSYTTPNVDLSSNGQRYQVIVTNSRGSMTSNEAVLGVIGRIPSIKIQPLTQTVGSGQALAFNVVSTGYPTLNYQWRKNGVDIAGANDATYRIGSVSPVDHNMKYSVDVANSYGRVTSNSAWVSLGGGVNEATHCAYSNTSTGNDPLLSHQWHIKNTNQYFATNNPANGTGIDLCMGNLWESGITGSGIKVNIVDTGLEIAHKDLASRIVPGGSYNFVTKSTDPTNTNTDGDHGTSVAGLIAATKDNGIGISGIAYNVNLQAYNYLSSNDRNFNNKSISFGGDNKYTAFNAEIFNFSAGFASSSLSSPNSVFDKIYSNMTNLRSGKGAILVKSAGNQFNSIDITDPGNPKYCQTAGVTCQNVNLDTGNTVYNTIVVAALDADGTKSSYSTTGSAIWLSGFGGEYGLDSSVTSGYGSNGYKPAMLTTDQSGCTAGYSKSGINANLMDKGNGTGVSNKTCDYTATFNGSSSAAPTVSGVIALMLQANPALTWRDVRHILATTARRVNPQQSQISNSIYLRYPFILEQGWVLNAGGYWYHNWYGFGLVNAAAAVALSQNYSAGNLGKFISETQSTTLGETKIVYAANGLTKTFAIAGHVPSTVEQAELTLYFGKDFTPLCHQIELTSPSGTKSIIMNMFSAITAASTSGVRFMSNAFYGEPAAGNWSLLFYNLCSSPEQILSSFDTQQLTIRGR